MDGETGVIVDPRDEGAFARPVLRLLRNPEEAKKLGQAGRARFLGHFTARRMAEAYVSMYTA
jgi:glycosyltransferase involved in cell wall biosynthesis